MKTKFFILMSFFFIVGFTSCNKEDDLKTYTDEMELPEKEVDLNAYADLDESVQAIIRSLDLSMRGLPANVNEITLSPTGAINSNGESRLVVATGSFTSAILVKAQDLSSAQELSSGSITGNGMMGYASLTIPAYNAASSMPARVVGFFYWGNTGQWELFHFETQAPGGTPPGPDDDHVVLSTGRHVAKWDAGMMDWASAMGIPSNYNSRYFYNSGYSDGTFDNFSYRASMSTGCNAYNEPGFPAGTWLLPTWAELQEICSKADEIGGFSITPYWSSTETAGRDGSTANYVRFPYNWAYELGNKYLTNNLRVRCVHP